jgi:hypothetical protein
MLCPGLGDYDWQIYRGWWVVIDLPVATGFENSSNAYWFIIVFEKSSEVSFD